MKLGTRRNHVVHPRNNEMKQRKKETSSHPFSFYSVVCPFSRLWQESPLFPPTNIALRPRRKSIFPRPDRFFCLSFFALSLLLFILLSTICSFENLTCRMSACRWNSHRGPIQNSTCGAACQISEEIEKNWTNWKISRVWSWPCGAQEFGAAAPSPRIAENSGDCSLWLLPRSPGTGESRDW